MKVDQSENLKLENDDYRVEVDSKSGVLISIFNKLGSIDFIIEPRLVDNFRLLLPLPNMQANYIYGKHQNLTKYEMITNGLILYWDGPLTNQQSAYNVFCIHETGVFSS